jgi:hypothetical protein
MNGETKMETRIIDGMSYEIKTQHMGAEVYFEGEPIGHFCKTSSCSSATPHVNGYGFYGYYVSPGTKQPLTVINFKDYPDAYAKTFDDAVSHIIERHIRSRAASLLGKIGGSATSKRKAESSRENGKKGGRPKNKINNLSGSKK